MLMLPTLARECSEYLMESDGHPLLKNLPTYKDGFSKVKVRHQRVTNSFIESFNSAFSKEHSKLFQRSVFARGASSFTPSPSPTVEPFYIFPANGYKYMYNPMASTQDYHDTFNKLLADLGDLTPDVFKDLLKYDYVFDNLSAGIAGGSEIVLYGISHFFALRKSLVDDYQDFIRS